MSDPLIISTWFYGEQSGEESYYPQVAGSPSTSAFQAIYWRCVVTFFATSVRFNPGARHILFVTTDHIPVVDSLDVGSFLKELEVEIQVVPFTYRTPEGFYGAWRNQFYVFDIITRLAEICDPSHRCLLLDSDCIWTRPAIAIGEDIAAREVLLYDVYDTDDWDVNGLNAQEMRLISESLLNRPLDRNPRYYGGEVFAATGEAARRIARELGDLWNQNIQRFEAGKAKFNEEAHALSFLYLKLGYTDRDAGSANQFIRRMWTSFRYSNVGSSTDFDLAIWHLPAEKRWGLKRLFVEVRSKSSPFWHLKDNDLRRLLGRYLGVPRRSLLKLILDLGEVTLTKATSKINRIVR